MKKNFIVTLMIPLLSVFSLLANETASPTSPARGYFSAPYSRYEAEPGKCKTTGGAFLEASDYQRDLQSEASNQIALTLQKGESVEWTNSSGKANALTLRFSVPDGCEGCLEVRNGEKTLAALPVSAEHSWQYCEESLDNRRNSKPEKYPYKKAVSPYCPIVRMRFDEVHKLLGENISTGDKFTLHNVSEVPVTVDFVELEYAEKTDAPEGAAVFDGSDLQEFIMANKGKTIYIPEGDYVVDRTIDLSECPNTTVTGAGIWFTNLYFPAKSNYSTGFFNTADNVTISNLYMDSGQVQRYTDKPYASPGKGFSGSWGTSVDNKSRIENVWVEHFECGAWIADYSKEKTPHGLTVKGCRIRNNYADGINLCRGSNYCVVEDCNFRNNGDDDMASWSADNLPCHHNIFRNCTAEHNWRASSVGLFGGYGHRVENLLIKDGLESGVRLVSDFNGADFNGDSIEFSDISIIHCGCVAGAEGEHGDFWGIDQGALHIESSRFYDIERPVFRNIDIYDSRGNGVFIGSTGYSLNSLLLENVNVFGSLSDDSYGYYFENPVGDGRIVNAVIEMGDGARNTNLSKINANFAFE